jgi:hypothetical protein
MTQRMASPTPRLTWMASTKARSTARWVRMVLPMEQTMARASLWHRAIAIIIQLKTPGMGACNSTEGGPVGSYFCRIFRSCFFATLHSFRLSYDIFDTSQQRTSATSTSTRHNGPLLSSSSSLGTDGNDDGSLDLDGTEDGIDDASIDLDGLDEGKVDGALDSDGTADGTDDGSSFLVAPGYRNHHPAQDARNGRLQFNRGGTGRQRLLSHLS